MASRMPAQKPGKSGQSVQTPEDFLEAVRNRFDINQFDFDLAADENNSVVPSAAEYDSDGNLIGIVKYHYDIEDNALVQNWGLGLGWNWCNPPYGDIGPWVKKGWEESRVNGAHTIMLVPASVGTQWWKNHVEGKAYVTFLQNRIKFVGHTSPFPKDLALLLYAPFLEGGHTYWSWKKS